MTSPRNEQRRSALEQRDTRDLAEALPTNRHHPNEPHADTPEGKNTSNLIFQFQNQVNHR